MLYTVNMERITTLSGRFYIEADSEEEARRQALEAAGDGRLGPWYEQAALFDDNVRVLSVESEKEAPA